MGGNVDRRGLKSADQVGIISIARLCRRHLGANSLRIEVNGEGRDTAAMTILGLVQELSLDPKKVAVERNLEIVPRSLHGETALAEGDKIELVQFVGGG